MSGHSRWVAVGLFCCFSLSNYLDRQLLPALAPEVRKEFGLSHTDYGWLLAVFSVSYALAAPIAGALVDRLGLTVGAALLLGAWNVVTLWTGVIATAPALFFARALLGALQAGGVPAAGKAVAHFLPVSERALGTACTQVGLSAGAILAPVVAGLMLPRGWRWAFVMAGLAGLLWIPAWVWFTSKLGSAGSVSDSASASKASVLVDPRAWLLAVANVLYMSLYSLWSNWTSVFLVEQYRLPLAVANSRFAWVPPLAANLGGLAGGWLAMRWIGGGEAAEEVRYRVCRLAALLALTTALAPGMPTPAAATGFIALSFFAVTAMSVNVYALAMDVFGPTRAGLAVALLTSSYGWMQAIFSPVVGWAVEHFGFGGVCTVAAFLPLSATGLIGRTVKRHAKG